MMEIKELVKNEAYILEFESGSFFDDSIKEGDKYVYHRVGDISRRFPNKRYSLVIKDVNDLTREELMIVFSSLVSDIQHKERIITAVTNLLK